MPSSLMSDYFHYTLNLFDNDLMPLASSLLLLLLLYTSYLLYCNSLYLSV